MELADLSVESIATSSLGAIWNDANAIIYPHPAYLSGGLP